MRKIGLYIVTPILSFFGGFYFYAWAMKFFTDGELDGDTDSFLFWGGMAYLFFAVPLYFAIIYFMDRKLNRFKFLLYPIGCMVVFFIPVSWIMSVFSGSSFFSPEAMLFHSFFLSTGLIFGIFNWLFKNFSFLKENAK